LGRAMDLVVTKVSDTLPEGEFDVYVPSIENVRGERVTLNVPTEGFIESVFQRYQKGRSHPLTMQEKVYTKNPQRTLAYALFELTEPVPLEYTSHVTAWIRHATMEEARKDVAEAISGHGPFKERLMIVPVPTLDWNDNRIRRVIITGENEQLV